MAMEGIEAARRRFEVERRLADRLRESTREERLAIYPRLYDDYFRECPDHPRLTRRETPAERDAAVAARMRLLRPFLALDKRFVEFAPGDCRLAFEVAKEVRSVVGIDISDQSGAAAERPENFRMVVYDGFDLETAGLEADLVFSYQFIEHLHPDDVDHHFALAAQVVRPGGQYVFSTPHAFSGPHDVSRRFSDVPLGFHLKEWTYGELFALVRRHGFRRWYTFRFGRPRPGAVFNGMTLAAEWAFGRLPRKLQRRWSQRLFQGIAMVAER